MAFHDYLAEGTAVEVVLRFPGEDGVIGMTDSRTLAAEKEFLHFKRDADGGIGELAHRYARVTWVVPLGDGQYRLEDPWHTSIHADGRRGGRRRSCLSGHLPCRTSCGWIVPIRSCSAEGELADHQFVLGECSAFTAPGTLGLATRKPQSPLAEGNLTAAYYKGDAGALLSQVNYKILEIALGSFEDVS
jgi:hypothetical protein